MSHTRQRPPQVHTIAKRAAALTAVLAFVATSCGTTESQGTNALTSTDPTVADAPKSTSTSEVQESAARPEVEQVADIGAAAPANDKLGDALEIDPSSLPFEQSLDVTGATSDSDDVALACPAPTHDTSIWYSITPTSDMILRIDPEASDFPAGVSVAIGSPGSLELLECRPFAFTIPVEAGEVYYFQAFDGDDPSSQGGSLSFILEQVELQSTDGLDALGQEFVQAVASDIEIHDGGFLFAVTGKDRPMVAGSNGVDAGGIPPTADDAFQIGGISKVFTAVLTLTLVDEDLVDLDASAGTYVTRVDVPDAVTVRDLLQHTSGIYNYTEHRDFFDALFADPGRVWSPEDAVEWAADQPPLFDPGSEFSYSNTNYTILGILIEEVTGQTYHDVLRQRIVEPLGLTSTYLPGFDEGPATFDPFDHEGDPDYDYTAVATSAWSAGGLVSSVGDLHALFTELFDGQIVSSELIEEMIAADRYGLGLEIHDSSVAHSGGILGYETFVLHSPSLGVTAFLASTSGSAKTDHARQKLAEGISALESN